LLALGRGAPLRHRWHPPFRKEVVVEIFVIRHAIAVPRSPDLDDAARPLTPRGRARWEKAVAGLERLGVRFDLLVHSPWRRAVETARVARRLVDGETVASALLATSPTERLLDEIVGERVALVGHEPWLGELLSLLIVGTTRAGPRLELRKGGVAWLSGDPRPGAASVRAILPPQVLRALARKR
jgi:phosphohistidine phosphatase